MEYRRLGATHIVVSAVTMGCWAIVGDATWGPQDESDSIGAIRAALDAGITTFDTAEGYGAGYSETLVGKALAGVRDRVIIASKVSADNLAAPDLKAACERSLKRLATDYIDLYQIHWPSRRIPLAETLGVLEELKTSGKIRAIGVCNFGQLDMDDLLSAGRAESNQLPYNLLFRATEFGVQAQCAVNDTSILCYCPLAQGLLTGKFNSADDVPVGRARTRHFSRLRAQTRHGEEGHEDETFEAINRIRGICDELGEPMERVTLAWLLHQPAVATAIAGIRNADQARRNAAAGSLALSRDVISQLCQATDSLKVALGSNPDMWQTQAQSRFR
jgi:myo-inositol catabolism protein IolS